MYPWMVSKLGIYLPRDVLKTQQFICFRIVTKFHNFSKDDLKVSQFIYLGMISKCHNLSSDDLKHRTIYLKG